MLNLMQFLITLSVRPQVSTTSAYTAKEGQIVVLQCSIVAANPTPNLIWTSPTLSTIPNINGTIALSSVKRNQQGEYTCMASNRVGSVARKTFLTVNCMYFFLSCLLILGKLMINMSSLNDL